MVLQKIYYMIASTLYAFVTAYSEGCPFLFWVFTQKSLKWIRLFEGGNDARCSFVYFIFSPQNTIIKRYWKH
jgi:hypothetical protein